MSNIALVSPATGTATFSITTPSGTSTDRTLTLPDAAGTIQVSGNPISGTTGTFTGLVDISAAGAGQIQFPATQNASANANTLDDYEEGTWTPTLTPSTSGTITLNTSLSGGFYVKIGRQVTLEANFEVSAISSPVGFLTIGGAPFTSNNSPKARRAGSVFFNAIASANIADMMVYMNNDITDLFCVLGNGTSQSLASAQQVTASTTIRLSITYFTS
jgi:hypothetical protein